MIEKYVLEVVIDHETGEEHCTVLKTDGTTNMVNWIEIISAMYTHHSILEPLVDELNKNYNGYSNTEKHAIKLWKENEQLKNEIDVLEDDNETYHKSLEKLNLYTKRFIPTKCTNEFKDCKTNRYYWLDHEGNFKGCLELLNLLDCDNELLKAENTRLKAILMEYEEQIKGDLE